MHDMIKPTVCLRAKHGTDARVAPVTSGKIQVGVGRVGSTRRAIDVGSQPSRGMREGERMVRIVDEEEKSRRWRLKIGGEVNW